MKTEQTPILKIAILNDLMELQLANLQIDRILEPETKCKLKNAKKNAEILTAHFGNLIGDVTQSELFGDICDHINEFIDEVLKAK